MEPEKETTPQPKPEPKPAATTKPSPGARTEVTLKQPHTHRRQACVPGDKIEVTDRQAAWLKKQGTI